MNVTRDVIIDLWAVYTSGEASADTRLLVEQFLKSDSELARLLNEQENDEMLKSEIPNLPPDHEAQAFNQTKRRLHGWDWSYILLMLSWSFTVQAFVRIVADTSWNVSPRNFIIVASIAAVAWTAYYIRRLWLRRKFYQKRVGSFES